MKTAKLIPLLFAFLLLLPSGWADWEELSLNTNPDARSDHSMVQIGSLIYVFGGKNENGNLNDLWKWDPQTGGWEEIITSDGPSARHGHSACVVDDKMLVFFGEDNEEVTKQIWQFDPRRMEWFEMPASGVVPAARKNHISVYLPDHEKVFVHGGTNGSSTYNYIYSYDPFTGEWVVLERTTPSRKEHDGVGYDNKLIFFGGQYSNNAMTNEVWEWDPDLGFDIIDDFGPLPGRKGGTMILKDDELHIIGGEDDNGDDLDDHWVFDLETGNWVQETNILQGASGAAGAPFFGSETGGRLAKNRRSPCSEGEIILFGGISNGVYQNKTWIYRDCQAISTGIVQEICDGEEWEGYSTTGNYIDTLCSAAGCDSIRTLQLTVLPHNSETIETSICQGENYEGYTASGLYQDTLTASNGCDSFRTINLTVLPEMMETLSPTICSGETYEGYTQSGEYQDTLIAINGCDSIRIIQLTVFPIYDDSISMTICEGDSYEGYTQSGTFIDPFTSSLGCDSTRTLLLSVVPPITLIDTLINPDDGSGNGSIEPTLPGNPIDYKYQWSTGDTTMTIDGLTHGDYELTIIDLNDCETTFTFTVPMSTSSNEFQSRLQHFYPNPVKEVLYFTNPDRLLQVKIYNSNGLIIKDFLLESDRINLSELSPGLYFLQLDNKTRDIHRLIKI